VGELVPGGQAHQGRAGKLAERQADRLLQDASGSERGERGLDSLVVPGQEISGTVVPGIHCIPGGLGRGLIGCGPIGCTDGVGRPAGRADEMVDQGTHVPRYARRRRAELTFLDLGQDGTRAGEGPVERPGTGNGLCGMSGLQHGDPLVRGSGRVAGDGSGGLRRRPAG
jgi:hypothetical protein